MTETVATVNRADLEARKAAAVREHGPWTAHNLHLGGGLYTMSEAPVGDALKLRRVLQLVHDLQPKPVAELRVLDLACLEGLYAAEFALRGAEVVGIEGRAPNLDKARFAKEALGLHTMTLLQDDVRNLSRDRHGTFDVVLCLGILYHLDAPDVFTFVERLGEVCRDGGLLVVDTHVSLRGWTSRSHRGQRYRGKPFQEHPPFSSRQQRLAALWSSLDNRMSFWLTRDSLVELLMAQGFSAVLECLAPAQASSAKNRVTLVAKRSDAVTPHVTPLP